MTKLFTMGGVHIPPAILCPLHQPGITDHTRLINQAGTHLVSCIALYNLYGSAVSPCHKQALN